jgi:uncharacterized protein
VSAWVTCPAASNDLLDTQGHGSSVPSGALDDDHRGAEDGHGNGREATMAHANEDLLRRGYAAFAKGDMETLNELFADNITWHSAGDNPLAGDYHGKQEVFGLFARLSELSDSFDQELHDVLANDEHGVGLVRVRASRGDRTMEQNAVHVYHFTGGQVSEVWVHNDDQAAADAFFG